MQVWAIVVIAVSAVVAVVALGVLIWLWVRPPLDGGERQHLLGTGPSVGAANVTGRTGGASSRVFQCAYLDPDALFRVVQWCDDVIRQSRAGDGIVPLPEHRPFDTESSEASTYLGPNSPASMLGASDSDISGLHTPRHSNVLTPRVSEFDPMDGRTPLDT